MPLICRLCALHKLSKPVLQFAQLNMAQSADDKLHNLAIWKDLEIVQIGRLRGNSTLVLKPKVTEGKFLEMFLF